MSAYKEKSAVGNILLTLLILVILSSSVFAADCSTTCTDNGDCDTGQECLFDDGGSTKRCTPNGACCYSSGSQASPNDYSPNYCYSAGSGGTPGAKKQCLLVISSIYGWLEASSDCGYQSNSCNAQNCAVVREANACSSGSCSSGGAGDDTVSDCSGQVCDLGSCITPNTPSRACDGDSNYWASLGDCSADRRLSACSGPSTCDTDASDYYAIYDYTEVSPSKVASDMSGSTYMIEQNAGIGSSCDSSVDYWSTYQSCTYTRRYAECNGAGNCDTDASNYYQLYQSYNVPSGSVGEDQAGGTDSSPYQAGSCSFYTSIDTSDRCSEASSPESGFGDREYDFFECDGSGGSAQDGGDCTTDCGTGCCYDAGATTSCVSGGGTSNDFWDFGTGDSGENDYCSAAHVYDCNTTAQCEAGYECTHNSCLYPGNSVIFKGTAGSDLAMMDPKGKIILKGTLTESSGGVPSGFRIQGVGGSPVAWITTAGALHITGTAYQSSSNPAPSGNDDFILMNRTGSVLLFIDGSTGDLYTRSKVIGSTI